MLLTCWHCTREAQVSQIDLGALVPCPHCGQMFVATPTGAEPRRALPRQDLWWFEGDPHLDESGLLEGLRASHRHWRVTVVPTRLRALHGEIPRVALFGRRHVALADPLVRRLVRRSRASTVLLSPYEQDRARSRRLLPGSAFLSLPTTLEAVRSKLRDLCDLDAGVAPLAAR